MALAEHPKVIAIGETGLDYYWQKDKPEWQRERFRTHIRAAKACGKPLVVHTRESAVHTLRLLKEEGADAVGGVMHCFTESWDIARQALDLGFHLSFSGIVTFKNALIVKEVAQKCPLDRMLVETDAPYLAPVPYRGKQNEPAYVRHVAEEIARLTLPVARGGGAGNDDQFHSFVQNSCDRSIIMKKKLLSTLLALAFSSIVGAATYDDLISGAKMGDTGAIADLVGKGASVHTTDIDGNTLLMLAARDGHADLVRYLIGQRAKLNARNSAGDTALRLASFRGHLPVVELLITGGASVNMTGWTPLAYASFSGHLDIAKRLIEAGADVNSSSENGTTPLIAAARSGYAEVVKLLLSRRANPNLKLDTGETALDVALKTNNTDIADMLRKAGAVSGRSVTIEVR